MEDEIGGYKEENYTYYYKEMSDRLVDFGIGKKDPYYVLDYLYRWFPFHLEKEERLGESWHEFNKVHCKRDFVSIPNSELLSWQSKWDTPENEAKASIMFKRYCKKSKALHKQLEENLILLIKLKDFLWT